MTVYNISFIGEFLIIVTLVASVGAIITSIAEEKIVKEG